MRHASGGRLTAKRLLVRHVVHEQDAHGAAVVRRRDGTESFLACGASAVHSGMCAVHNAAMLCDVS